MAVRRNHPRFVVGGAESNSARARAAGAVEALWIAELGDLTRYGVSPRVLEAVELRRDNPQLTYAQLGDKMGVTKDAYSGMIRRFRTAVNRGTAGDRRRIATAQWVEGLGDLTNYSLSERVRRSAELRRDHPELSLAQLAERMGVTRASYESAMHRFRVAMTPNHC